MGRGGDSVVEELCDALGSLEREDRDLPRTTIMAIACGEPNRGASRSWVEVTYHTESRAVAGAKNF